MWERNNNQIWDGKYYVNLFGMLARSLCNKKQWYKMLPGVQLFIRYCLSFYSSLLHVSETGVQMVQHNFMIHGLHWSLWVCSRPTGKNAELRKNSLTLGKAFQFSTHFGPVQNRQSRGQGHCRYNHLVKCEILHILKMWYLCISPESRGTLIWKDVTCFDLLWLSNSV